MVAAGGQEMKRLFLTLLILLVAAPSFAGGGATMMMIGGTVAGGAMNTVDMSRGFESGTSTGWTVGADAGSKITVQDGTQKHSGSYALSVNFDADNVIAYMNYDMGATKTALSMCIWFYAPTMTNDAAFSIPIMVINNRTDDGVSAIRLYYALASGQYKIGIRGADGPNYVDVTGNAWYRLEVNWVNNASSTLYIYDSSGAAVGNTSATSSNVASRYLHFGPDSTETPRGVMYFDDIGVDWTDSTTPLWEYVVAD